MGATLVESAQKQLLVLEDALQYVADNMGDMAAVVIETYYARYLEGVSSFRYHGFEGHIRLAESMVDSVFYCTMGWIDNRREIESTIAEIVLHHISIKILRDLFISFFEVALRVLLWGCLKIFRRQDGCLNR